VKYPRDALIEIRIQERLDVFNGIRRFDWEVSKLRNDVYSSRVLPINLQMPQAGENILQLLANDLHYCPTIRYSQTWARSTRLCVPK